MKLLRFVPSVLLVIAGLTGCHLDESEKPMIVPGSQDPIVRGNAVDPEIERWFRQNQPASGTRLMSGDRIRIEVQGKPELGLLRDVPPNGAVPVFRADKTVTNVNALGRTLQELEADIAAIHSADFVHPYVTVSLDSAAPRSISVFGAVKTPNAYPMSGNERLTVLQALTLAGGTLPQSDLSSVTIQRVHPATGMTVASPLLDLQLAIDRGDQRDNLIVEPGDTIVVPDLQQSSVQVLGNVERPGSVVWSRGITLARAVTEAGGFKRFAKIKSIKIVRHGREVLTINFDEVLEGLVPDPELEPRDVIYVAERWI